MSIYLTGGGDQECFHNLDQHFQDHIKADSKALILPHASDLDEFEEVLERIEEDFESRKIISFDLIKNPKSLSLEELLSYDILFIEGGNTFQLINETRDSQFFNNLKRFANSNKTIYADSAGAILLGTSVETAFLGDEGDEDHLKLQDYRGLDIVSPWSIHAHYEHEDNESLESFIYDSGSPVIALSEPAGVLIQENKIITMTEMPAKLFTFSGIETLKIGEELSF